MLLSLLLQPRNVDTEKNLKVQNMDNSVICIAECSFFFWSATADNNVTMSF